VDARIAALRARVLGLETYKRGLMQALFGQRLRFTQPDGTAFPDWEEKPFAEIATRVRKIFDPTKSDDRPTLVELENIESMSGQVIGESDLVGQISLKTEFKAGDVLFGKLRPYLRKFARPDFDGVCSSEIWVMRGTKVSNSFLHYLVQSTQFNQLANISSGSKMPRSDWAIIAESGFQIPHPDEQAKIAEALQSMDTKIAAVQAQVLKMQAFKKGLLQQMFV
jgi:type I restriction enzyme, S subunit